MWEAREGASHKTGVHHPLQTQVTMFHLQGGHNFPRGREGLSG
jgi:hypothetical protein